MSVEIKTPELPESVDEATLLTWHAEDGAAVRRDDKIADVETDKIVLEVFAPADGILHALVKEGGTLKRGDKIARIDGGGASTAPVAPVKTPVADEKTGDSSVAPGNPDGEDDEFPKTKGDIDSDEVTQAELAGLPPGVRKLLMENGIHPSDLTGSGKDGRITRADVLKFIEETPLAKKNIGLGEASTGLVVMAPPASRKEAPAAPRGMPDPHQRRVPMSQLRQRVATRLKEVQNTAALLTTFNEVNMKPVMDMRATYKERFEKEYGVKLGFMSFFVKAAVEALKKYPVVNAALDGKDIVFHEAYHIGIAVDSPRGLVVPVLRHAERLGFAEVEKTIRDLATKAKDAKLAYEDLIGGTFTITNGGVFGSMLSTPIINAPQSAILGMHAIQDRPWVEAGQVVVRPVMYLALTYDHRLIDGRDAVQFLVSLKESLEDPAQLLLQL